MNSTLKTIGWRIYANDTSGNQNDTGIQTLTIVHGTKIPQVLVNNTNPTAGDSVKIDAKLKFDNGTAIADQNISFYYDSSFINYDYTNASGWATVVWDTPYISGTYTINASYGGNASIQTASCYNNTQQVSVTGAADIYVNTTGWWRPGQAFNASGTPIQHAIDNATASENLIVVKDGTYTENVNVNKQLTIQSENGYASTTVHAASSSDHVFEVTADYVNISGFTATGATGAAYASGIALRPNVDHCNISNNNCSYNYLGISLTGSSSSSRCSYNKIINNTANFNHVGLNIITYSDNNTVTNNTANSNYDGGSGYGYGIRINNHADNNEVYYNRFENNSNEGIHHYASTGNKIFNNLFNNTVNHGCSACQANEWNATRQTGTRIYSDGTEIGGNYWTNPSGTGYSDTCTDSDKDGFCDNSYSLGTAGTDYLPLSDEAGWNSYNDSAHNNPDDTFSGDEHTVYMHGTGFTASHDYKVAYYDADNYKVATEFTNASDSDGNLSSQYYFPTNTSAAAGLWHSVVYDATVSPSSTYNPDDPDKIADDSFTVEESAIPEFPAVIAAIAVCMLCAGAYMVMRRKEGKS